MLKRLKSASLLLTLASVASGGAVHASSGLESEFVKSVQQASICKGIVKDAQGEAIIGASVVVKGTVNGTITDMDGAFTLKDVQKGAVIQVSFVGYQTTDVVWDGTSMDITLKDDTEVLDEVVVVGYGTQKKANVTGALSMVDSKALDSRPVQNVAQALQGQIPGLTMSVGNSGGALDGNMGVTIRGNGTIGSGSSGKPLILIDGIEGDMNTVNPNDIANVSVLKDAASASIYGARAAFGVILITTKNGQSGKTRVNYSGNVRSFEVKCPFVLPCLSVRLEPHVCSFLRKPFLLSGGYKRNSISIILDG